MANDASINIWSTLIIISIAQGLFTMTIMVMKQKRSGSLWLFLSMILFLIWLQLEFLAIRWPYDVGVSIFYGTRYGSWLLLGPLFYWLVRATVNQHSLSRKDLIHAIPFLIFTLIIPNVTGDILSYRQVHYGMLTVFDQYNKEISTWQYVYSYLFVFQFIHFIAYLIVSNRLLSRHEESLKNQYSGHVIHDTKWLKRLSIYLMIVMAFVALFLLIFFFTEIYRRHMDYLYVLPMAVLMYIIAYRMADVKQVTTRASNGVAKYEKSSLDPSDAKKYAEQLERFMQNEQPYLINELRLQDLAESIGIPPHHLSQVINHNLKTTFFDYVNRYRVTRAKQLIASESDFKSLLGIAFDSGFNNKTSFVNAFKKHEGVTPSAFRKQIEVALN
ncbi:Helix-turn-helix domain-containing protein [Ekhidna lutea]|uniref:Helix-turn-helix domain-containing protein n=1 Tax=Ekhidna lutea TaxID=447679 RepID=A0A239HA65_EKHLU|nr:helix-turn-helix domain-containing protein [Ekhidna lutea]SNS78035.1 Helix-turn-helix domain-containing protein [Ekhidna lutea]